MHLSSLSVKTPVLGRGEGHLSDINLKYLASSGLKTHLKTRYFPIGFVQKEQKVQKVGYSGVLHF